MIYASKAYADRLLELRAVLSTDSALVAEIGFRDGAEWMATQTLAEQQNAQEVPQTGCNGPSGDWVRSACAELVTHSHMKGTWPSIAQCEEMIRKHKPKNSVVMDAMRRDYNQVTHMLSVERARANSLQAELDFVNDKLAELGYCKLGEKEIIDGEG